MPARAGEFPGRCGGGRVTVRGVPGFGRNHLRSPHLPDASSEARVVYRANPAADAARFNFDPARLPIRPRAEPLDDRPIKGKQIYRKAGRRDVKRREDGRG